MNEPIKTDPYADCRIVLDVLGRIGDKWTVMVVGALSAGPQRFNAMRRGIEGISHRMLTLTLRTLERDGLVLRTVHASVPPAVEYELTALGRSLIGPLTALAQWARDHQVEIEATRARG